MSLFADTADLATLTPILETASWTMIKPTVDLIERQYLRDDVLGAAIYDDLLAAYNASIADTAPVPLTADQQALFDRCRPAVASLASSIIIAKNGIQMTSAGPMVSETSTQKPAPMWRTKQAQAQHTKEGLSYLDQLIDFLLDSADTYGWQTGVFATRVKTCLVRTVKDMADVNVDIGNSGWLLHKLRPALVQQQKRVLGVICEDAFNDLLSAVQAGVITGANASVIGPARSAIIYLAMADMALLNSITIDGDGAWTWQSANNSATSGGAIPAQNPRLDHVIREYRQRGEEQLKELDAVAKKLAAAASYPLYLNSPCYVVPSVRGGTTPDCSSTFSFL